jgi:hypothetical protein
MKWYIPLWHDVYTKFHECPPTCSIWLWRTGTYKENGLKGTVLVYIIMLDGVM